MCGVLGGDGRRDGSRSTVGLLLVVVVAVIVGRDSKSGCGHSGWS